MKKEHIKNRMIAAAHFLKMGARRRISMKTELNTCGTRGCLAGETAIALANAGQNKFRSLIDNILDQQVSPGFVVRDVSEALGLPRDDADKLFYKGPDGQVFSKCRAVVPCEAAAAILKGAW